MVFDFYFFFEFFDNFIVEFGNEGWVVFEEVVIVIDFGDVSVIVCYEIDDGVYKLFCLVFVVKEEVLEDVVRVDGFY